LAVEQLQAEFADVQANLAGTQAEVSAARLELASSASLVETLTNVRSTCAPRTDRQCSGACHRQHLTAWLVAGERRPARGGGAGG